MGNVQARVLIGSVTTVVFAALVASCGGSDGGDDTPPAQVTTPANIIRSATLSSAQEAPAPPAPNPSATGRGAVVVNSSSGEITGGATFSGLSGAATDAHIHQAAAGQPGGVIIPLTLSANGTAAIIPAGTTLSAAQLTALQAGELYFNVHTAANPNGEIRGQITGTGGVVAGLASLTGAQETPASTSTATGRGTIVVDSTTREIITSYATHEVGANANNAHIHQAPAGTAGGVIVGLVLGTGVAVASQGASLTAAQFTALQAGELYFNVHSTNNLCAPAANCAAGEIRGQIGVVQ
jgi:hypothetical protein